MIRIEVKHTYSFSPTEIFEAFLNASTAEHFMFRTDSGKVVKAEVNPELGGTFTFIESRDSGQAEHYGTFVEIEKPERLTFVFHTQMNPDESDYVELTFQPKGSGCELLLTTDIKPEYQEHKKKFENSWAQMLERLDLYLSNKEAKSKAGAAVRPKDSLGNELSEGDTVKTIKDLNVKGSSMVVKRGTLVKKIHLISGNDEEVDCKVDGVALTLETQWLTKV